MSYTLVKMALQVEGLASAEKLVFACLCSYVDEKKKEEGKCWPMQTTLATMAGYHKDTVGVALNKLKDKGFIVLKNTGGGNIYWVTLLHPHGLAPSHPDAYKTASHRLSHGVGPSAHGVGPFSKIKPKNISKNKLEEITSFLPGQEEAWLKMTGEQKQFLSDQLEFFSWEEIVASNKFKGLGVDAIQKLAEEAEPDQLTNEEIVALGDISKPTTLFNVFRTAVYKYHGHTWGGAPMPTQKRLGMLKNLANAVGEKTPDVLVSCARNWSVFRALVYTHDNGAEISENPWYGFGAMLAYSNLAVGMLYQAVKLITPEEEESKIEEVEEPDEFTGTLPLKPALNLQEELAKIDKLMGIE